MLLKKTRTRVAGSLIAGIALLMGVSQVMAEPKQLEISKPKTLEVSEPGFIKVSKQGALGVSSPKSSKVTKGQPLKLGTFAKGEFIRPVNVNPAYTRCAKRKGFDERMECALEGLSGDLPEENN